MLSCRPYFTYWVSFVQLVVLIVTLAVNGFAPIGFTFTERNALVSIIQTPTNKITCL